MSYAEGMTCADTLSLSNAKRIMVIGNAGGGKTRLSRRISAHVGLPYHAVDDMLWKPGWERVDEPAFLQTHAGVVAQDQWLVDGVGSWASVEARLVACDMVVFVDLPFTRHLRWAAKRQMASLLGREVHAPEGCKLWPVTFRLFAMMWWVHRNMRPRLIQALARADDKQVLRINTRRALNDLVERLA